MGNPNITLQGITDWERLPPGYRHLDVAGVAVDAQDRVYLLARLDPRVLVYEPDGAFVMSWGEEWFSPRPHAITVGPDGAVYCVDDGDHTVHKCTPDGKLLMTLGTRGVASDTGCTGPIETIRRGGPPFNHPTAVDVAANGDIYVTDGYGNARVHRFAADGQLIASWGEPGSGPGQFMLPHGVCILPDGRVAVADRENDRIQVFSATGEFITQWTDIQRPTALRLGPDGLLYVTELGWRQGARSFRLGPIAEDRPNRVGVYDLQGQVVWRAGSTDPCAPGSFAAPHGIAVDSRGSIYVAEVTYAWAVKPGDVPADCHVFQKLRRA